MGFEKLKGINTVSSNKEWKDEIQESGAGLFNEKGEDATSMIWKKYFIRCSFDDLKDDLLFNNVPILWKTIEWTLFRMNEKYFNFLKEIDFDLSLFEAASDIFEKEVESMSKTWWESILWEMMKDDIKDFVFGVQKAGWLEVNHLWNVIKITIEENWIAGTWWDPPRCLYNLIANSDWKLKKVVNLDSFWWQFIKKSKLLWELSNRRWPKVN